MRFISDDPSQRDLSYKGGLKVIAAGLPRTGTSSLQYAFENDLGFGPCMHFAYIAPHTDLLKLCYNIELETDKEKRHKMLHKLFDGYVATADMPGCFFVEDLIEMYPDAMVVLNQRSSAQKWLKSFKETMKFMNGWSFLILTGILPNDYWMWQVMQGAKLLHDRRHGLGNGPDGLAILELYDAHNNWVREVAKSNGKAVLEWQPEHGWAPVCKFLGKPVPNKPFPRLNDERTMRILKVVKVVRGVLAWGALFSSVGLAYWGGSRLLVQ